MQICAKCKKEMLCKKTGVICRWGEAHCYSGDLFECKECNTTVINTSAHSFHSDKQISSDILFQMD